MRIALLIIKILLTVAFVAAGAAKLIGAPGHHRSRRRCAAVDPSSPSLGRGSAGCDNGWGCARSLGGSGHEHRRAVDRAGTALRLCSVVAPKGLPGAVPMGLSPA